ncbi:MAG: 3-hydroxybutyrate dehydrogenase [Paenibacillaceae bacterium]|nr:3-hydroxybutyrate dehydrogenase [Paenibacillaceae bacterium]
MWTNKVAVVTGSAGGIGYAIGAALAEQGATVVLSDRDEAKVQQAAETLRTLGRHVVGRHADVAVEADLEHLIGSVREQYGRLDIWVNNAGMQHVSPIETFPTETFEKMVRVMLTAPFIAIKHLFPLMKAQGGGRILNIASINGVIGFAGKAAYNSAKHGVVGLTKVAALEGAPYGITVNALCPGYVDTPLVRGQLQDLAASRGVPLENVLEEVIYPLVPQRRLLDVGEVADYAVFLASDKAKGVTGQAVLIDGGYTAQ